jgi:hypothetical protein
MPRLTRERELKVIAFPEPLYEKLRSKAQAENRTNRQILRRAIRRYAIRVEKLLAKAGFAPNEGKRKLVRTALDATVLNRLREISERSGVDTTALIFLCLRNYLGVRLGDPGREALLHQASSAEASPEPQEAASAAPVPRKRRRKKKSAD